jgi:hypothetical protein
LHNPSTFLPEDVQAHWGLPLFAPGQLEYEMAIARPGQKTASDELVWRSAWGVLGLTLAVGY